MDFCDSQDLESPKTRVSSLLDSLCHNIDGFLSYLIETILKLTTFSALKLFNNQQNQTVQP
jgi:hypothetical protein